MASAPLEVRFPQEIDIPVDGFKPDDRHWAYLRCISTSEKTLSIHKIADIIDVPVSTVHDWHQRPDFQEWVATNREMFLKGMTHQVYSSMLERAIQGSAPHQKMFLERFDPKFVLAKKIGKDGELEETQITDNMLLEFLMKRCNLNKQTAVRLIAGKAKIVENAA